MSAPPRVEALRAKLAEHGAVGFLALDPDRQLALTGFRPPSVAQPSVLLIGATRSMLIVPEPQERSARLCAGVDCVKSYDPGAEAGAPGSCERLLGALLDVLPEGAPIAVDEQRLPLAVADRMRAHGHAPLPFAAVVRELADEPVRASA